MATQSNLPSPSHPPVIFTCSGAADVGEIADQASRQLARQGVGVLSCLAGVAARVEPIMTGAQNAPAILAIDGCPQDCVAKTLSAAQLTSFHHIRLSDLGMAKKESPLTEYRVERVVQVGEAALRPNR